MIVTALGWRLKYLNTMTVMITIYEITITMTLDAPLKFRVHITMTNNDKAKQPRAASTQHTAPSSAATEATTTKATRATTTTTFILRCKTGNEITAHRRYHECGTQSYPPAINVALDKK